MVFVHTIISWIWSTMGFVHIRRKKKREYLDKKVCVMANTGLSAGSMVICCLHHIVDLLPFLGLSVAMSVIKYQTSLIILGIFFNLLGIMMMLVFIQEYNLYNDKGDIGKVFRNFNMKILKRIIIVIGVIVP